MCSAKRKKPHSAAFAFYNNEPISAVIGNTWVIQCAQHIFKYVPSPICKRIPQHNGKQPNLGGLSSLYQRINNVLVQTDM